MSTTLNKSQRAKLVRARNYVGSVGALAKFIESPRSSSGHMDQGYLGQIINHPDKWPVSAPMLERLMKGAKAAMKSPAGTAHAPVREGSKTDGIVARLRPVSGEASITIDGRKISGSQDQIDRIVSGIIGRGLGS